MLNLGIAILFIYILFYQHNNLHILFSKCITFLTIILTGFGLLQFINIYTNYGITHHNLYLLNAHLGHKNIFSEILLLCFPFCLYILFASKNIFWKTTAILACFLTLAFVTITLSRAVWLAFILSLLSTFLVFLFSSKINLIKNILKPKYYLTILILSTSIFIAIFLYSQLDSSKTFFKQTTSIFNLKHTATKDRIELWKKTLKLSKEFPITGIDLGGWQVEIQKYGSKGLLSEDNITFYTRPHNDYLWILSEQGIIGLFLFFLIFILVIYYLFKILQKADSLNDKLFFIVLFFSLFSYLVFSFFSFPKERIEHQVFLAFIIAMTIISYNKIYPQSYTFKFNIVIPVITSILIIITSLIFTSSKFISEKYLKTAFEARAINNWSECIEQIDKANPDFYSLDPTTTPLYWYRGLANYNLNNTDQAFSDFLSAYKTNRYHIHVINNLATMYEIKGNHKKALSLYKKAIDISPGFDDAAMNIAAIYFNSGNIDSAYFYIQIPNTTSSHKNYKPYLLTILKAKIDIFKNKITNYDLKLKLNNIYNTEIWLNDIYFKSLKNNISFEKQLIIDIIWDIRIKDNNASLADSIIIYLKKNKFYPN